MHKNWRQRIAVPAVLGCLLFGTVSGLLEEKVGNHTQIALAASDYNNTETDKVEVDDGATIAKTGKYKDMDYSFMKSLVAGKQQQSKIVLTLQNVEKLETSTSKKLEIGAYIQTRGYYESGDGGAACYEVVEKDTGNCITLSNGKYAKLVPDTYTDAEGTVWAVANVKQFGAKGDGVNEDNGGINSTITFLGNYVKANASVSRGLVYLPEGEYKCTNQLFADTENLNIVGEGDKTIIFTDNDYRKEIGYSEHFFQVTSAKNMFFGNFVIEAREVDLYHYMRQFTLTYCEEVYVYQVDLLVPQESYNSYYFEDKQYSNFCCYCGNSNITVDGCTMKQLSGTYRGANLGILDIWSKGEKNITVMNCDLYGNARDEQIGFFSTECESAGVKNVDFINNTIHSVQLKYTDIIGTRTMCFTIAYADSKNVEDIRVAGNHFICETDSKFMTFGTVKNCVIEDNIIEIVASNGNMGAVFDTSNTNPDNILVRNNQFYITSKTGKEGKSNIINGALTFKNNEVFMDATMYLPMTYLKCKVDNNKIVTLKKMGELANDVYSFCNNTIISYGGMEKISTFAMTDRTRDVYVSGNTVYNYQRWFGTKSETGPWVSLHKIDGLNLKSYNFQNNTYYAPNRKFTETWQETYTNFLYLKTGNGEGVINYSGNTSQGVQGIINYGSMDKVTVNQSNNTFLPYEADEEEKIVSGIDVYYENEKATEITVTKDEVDLDTVIRIGTEMDEDGNVTKEEVTENKKVNWHSSVEKIATVSEDGKVTRHMYGDVTIYAVPLDGSTNYGVCTIHFEKAKATSLTMVKEEIELQPDLRFYAEYMVLPKGASQELVWSSSNEEVATVTKEGMITAVAEGTAIITGKTIDGSNLSKSIKVKVSPLTVKKITLDTKYKVLDSSSVGTQIQLSVASYYPENATNKGILRWESNHEDVATVDKNGLVTIVSCGGVIIRAYSMDGSCYATCNLYITGDKVPNLQVENITDNSATLTWDGKGLTGWGFNVYRWNFSTSEWEAVASNYYDNSYRINNLTKGTKYRYSVRYFIKGYDTGQEVVYTGKDTPIEFTTYTYKPVTSLKCSTDHISIPFEKEGEYRFTYSPADADYTNLKFDTTIADTDIAEITNIRKDGGNYYVTIKAKKYGYTSITMKCNDDKKAEVTVPIGVIVKNMVKLETFHATAEQNKITVEFGAIADETHIDGYYLTGVGEPVFIPKTGKQTYTYVYTKGLVAGKSYAFTVAPCVTDGTFYYTGYARDGAKATMPDAIKVSNVHVSTGSVIVTEGESVEVFAYCEPDEAENRELNWESDADDIASVIPMEQEDSKVETATITGEKAGETTVWVETIDGSDLKEAIKVVVLPKTSKSTEDNPKSESNQNVVNTTINGTKVMVLGYNGVYDAKAHDAVTLSGLTNKMEVTYSADGTNWISQMPTVTNVSDSKEIHVKIAVTGTSEVYVTKLNVVVNPASIVDQTFKLSSDTVYWSKNCKKPTVSSDSLVKDKDYTVSYPAKYNMVGLQVVTIKGIGNYTDSKQLAYVVSIKKGATYVVAGYKYKVLSSAKVAIVGASAKSKKKIVVKNTVTIGGKVCKIVEIGNNAFKNYKKLKKVTIGKNVTKIGAKAFYGAKNLNSIKFQGTKITKIGANAWKNINKNAVFEMKEKGTAKLKKMLTAKTGFVESMEIHSK